MYVYLKEKNKPLDMFTSRNPLYSSLQRFSPKSTLGNRGKWFTQLAVARAVGATNVFHDCAFEGNTMLRVYM